jgi:hypothetical protein
MQLTGYQQDWMSGLMIVDGKSVEFMLEAVDWYPHITICAVDKSGSGPIIVLFVDEKANIRTPTINILAGLGMCLFLAAIFCMFATCLTEPRSNDSENLGELDLDISKVVPKSAPDDLKTLPYTIYDVHSLSAFSAPPK